MVWNSIKNAVGLGDPLANEPDGPTRLPQFFPVEPKGCEKQTQKLFNCLSNEATEKLSRDNKAIFLIVAPQIRRHVAQFVRAQLSAVNVLSFTELPENRSVEIAYTVGGNEATEEAE